MRVRRLTPILGVLVFAACAAPQDVPEERTDTLPTQLPAAELPTYAKGDRYVFDNPREEWTIVSLGDGQVTWESSLGETRTTMFDPLLPPIAWKKADGSGGSRQILEWSGGLFPLKAGNKLTYKSAVLVNGESGHALFVWNCYAGNPRHLSVPAGDFATIPVFCRRSDGQKLHTFYAPALYNAASLVLTAPDGKETTRNLLSFEPGDGARVAATRVESLPGGWSAAAIADWNQDVAGLPRVRPEQVAEANPPVGLATPTDWSRNADEVPPAPPPPQRTMLAVYAPQITKPEATPAAPASAPPARAASAKSARYGAHVGSFGSRAAAERAWTIYEKKYAGLKGVTAYDIVPVNLGEPKGVLYRLLAGPSTARSDAEALCKVLRAERGYCRVIAIPAS